MIKKDLKIALCVIAKDREKQIVKLLDSTQGIFDLYVLQDTGSSDYTVDVWENWCKEHNKEFKTSKKFLGVDYKFVVVNGVKVLGDFGKARQDSFNMAKKNADFAMWIDSDDIINDDPQRIRSCAEEMNEKGIYMVLMPYIYAKPIGGLKPVTQKRERLIDIRVPGHWIDRVHEGYVLDVPAKLDYLEFSIQHERGMSEVLETGRRNNLIMHEQLKSEGIDKFSDKMLQNLAYDHWEHKEHKEAIYYYEILLNRKSAKEIQDLRFVILMKLARSYLEIGELDKAIEYSNKASDLSGFSDPFIILTEAYMRKGKWEDAIFYADKVISMGLPQTTNPINELEYTILPRQVKTNCLMNLGKFEEALKVSQEIYQLMPSPEASSIIYEIEEKTREKNAILGIINLLRYYQYNNLQKYINRVKEAIPLKLRENQTVRSAISEIMTDYKRKNYKIIYNGSKSIVIYAGQQVIEEWNGNSDIEKGIGGSEGMTIIMARELAKLGNKVIVYNNIKKRETYDDVIYDNYENWDADMKCDVFISLRRPDVFQKIIKAKKQYLWLHDTTYGQLPTSFFYTPNKIFVLSEAHKDIIKQEHHITDNSAFYLTRNSLNSKSLEYADKNAGKRNPYQLIYASSYDRGLDFVLQNWQKIKDAIPEATLKIFYGWNTFDSLANARQSKDMFQYKSYIIDLISKANGVQELGKISQNELYKQFAESSIWFYPTAFYEISCINAMTAQATGCIPVCTPYAALNETVSSKYGIKMDREEIVDALIYNLKNIDKLELKREEMKKWSRDQFDSAKLAKEWDLFFNKD